MKWFEGKPIPEKQDRKVEYIELIYDLIFVYLVSRNVAILNTVIGDFIRPLDYMSFLISSLAVLQVWYLSTLYINQYGDGSLREHLMLFFNMYVLYFMADGVRSHWGPVYYQYNGAWCLILLNLAFQYQYARSRSQAASEGDTAAGSPGC